MLMSLRRYLKGRRSAWQKDGGVENEADFCYKRVGVASIVLLAQYSNIITNLLDEMVL